MGSLCLVSSDSTSVSPPSIQDCRTASIQVGNKHLTSGLSLATNLYFGVSIPPTSKCVTSDVRSSLWIAPICPAIAAISDYHRGSNVSAYLAETRHDKQQPACCAMGETTHALFWENGGAAKHHAQEWELGSCYNCISIKENNFEKDLGSQCSPLSAMSPTCVSVETTLPPNKASDYVGKRLVA